MYLPKHFAEERTELLHAALHAHPFATLVTEGADGPVADHLPLLLAVDDGRVRLRGHVARANPLWRAHPPTRPVLAIFQGPDAYVTPNWYPSKREHGRAVPTWNYLAVHARGRLTVIDQRDWLHDLLAELTARHEADFAVPWQLSDAPPDYLEGMLKAVVGIEIEVAELSGKFKFSQNQSTANRAGVVDGLRAQDDDNAAGVADWVEVLNAELDAR